MDFRPNLPCKILICGDSISAGIMYDEKAERYVKSKECFVNLLQSSLNGVITNISRFGNTIITALPKLKRDMAKETPDIVFIELGGNDCDFKWQQVAENPAGDHHPATELSLFQNNLSGIVTTLRSKGIAPVLATLPPIDCDRYFKWVAHSSSEMGSRILEWLGSVSRIYWWHERYNAAVLKVVESTNAAWIDLRSAFLSTPDYRKYLCKDGIHPNSDGHKLISHEISDYLNHNYPMLFKPAVEFASGI